MWITPVSHQRLQTGYMSWVILIIIIKGCIAKERQEEVRAKLVKEEKWQGKMICNRWEDVHLEQGDCFALLRGLKVAPMHVLVGIQELYQQLLPTKVFYCRKVGTSRSAEERCPLCGKETESVPHILSGCGVLAQTLYLARHNNALKILLFQVIRDYFTKQLIAEPTN